MPSLPRFIEHAAYFTPQFTMMFALAMPIALLGALADDPDMALDNASLNSAMAASTMMRAVGKACNGVVVDSVGVKPFLMVVMLGPALASVAMSLIKGHMGLCCVLSVLAFCNSGAWLVGCKIIEARFKKEDSGGCFSILASCGRLGTLAARIGLGSLLAIWRWQSIALGTAPAMFLLWVLETQVLLRHIDRGNDDKGHLVVNPQDPDHEPGAAVKKECNSSREPRMLRIKRMALNRSLQLQATVLACTASVVSLENMTPLLLRDLTHLGHAEIGIWATVFPAGILCGVLVTPRLYARLPTPLHKLRMELTLHALSFVGLVSLCCCTHMASEDPGSVPTFYFLLSFILIAFGCALNFYIKPGIACLEFPEDCATASSMLDCCGYGAVVMFQLFSSSVFSHDGTWAHVVGVALGLNVFMAVFTVVLYVEQQGHFPPFFGLGKGHLWTALSSVTARKRSILLAVGTLVVLRFVHMAASVGEPPDGVPPLGAAVMAAVSGEEPRRN